MLIGGENGGEVFECTYQMSGFISPQDINIDNLTPKYASIDSQTGKSHNSLCKQVFEEERKYF